MQCHIQCHAVYIFLRHTDNLNFRRINVEVQEAILVWPFTNEKEVLLYCIIESVIFYLHVKNNLTSSPQGNFYQYIQVQHHHVFFLSFLILSNLVSVIFLRQFMHFTNNNVSISTVEEKLKFVLQSTKYAPLFPIINFCIIMKAHK